MAVVFMDGFDQYTDHDQLVQGPWTEQGSIYTGISTNTRFGRGQCIKLDEKNFDYAQCSDWGASQTTAVCGFAFNGSDSWYSWWLFRFLSNGLTQIAIQPDSAGHLEVYSSTDTLLGTTTAVFSDEIWYYLEVRISVHDTAGSVDIYANGDSVLSLTNRDTSVTGFGYVDGIQFGKTEDVFIDDVYVTDGEVDEPKTNSLGMFGPVEVITLMPDGDSTPIDWDNSSSGDADVGTNFDHVNELPKDDTSFVTTNTSGNADKYTYDDLPTGTWDVKAVQPMARVEIQGGGAEYIQLTAGTQVSSNLNAGVGSWEYVYEIFDYSTGTTDWTTSDINGLTVEVEYV